MPGATPTETVRRKGHAILGRTVVWSDSGWPAGATPTGNVRRKGHAIVGRAVVWANARRGELWPMWYVHGWPAGSWNFFAVLACFEFVLTEMVIRFFFTNLDYVRTAVVRRPSSAGHVALFAQPLCMSKWSSDFFLYYLKGVYRRPSSFIRSEPLNPFSFVRHEPLIFLRACGSPPTYG